MFVQSDLEYTTAAVGELRDERMKAEALLAIVDVTLR
jgi:hypothetical protein